MTKGYRCDTCEKWFETLPYLTMYDPEFEDEDIYDLCEECHDKFEKWMEKQVG